MRERVSACSGDGGACGEAPVYSGAVAALSITRHQGNCEAGSSLHLNGDTLG